MERQIIARGIARYFYLHLQGELEKPSQYIDPIQFDGKSPRQINEELIRRLLEGPPIVLATGGGAMMNAETRALLKERADTVWLRADLAVIAERVARRDTRPLLRGKDPLAVLTTLAEARYPIYGEADVTVDVGQGSHGQAVDAIHKNLRRHWRHRRRAETRR